jgi:hypothetical protein
MRLGLQGLIVLIGTMERKAPGIKTALFDVSLRSGSHMPSPRKR